MLFRFLRSKFTSIGFRMFEYVCVVCASMDNDIIFSVIIICNHPIFISFHSTAHEIHFRFGRFSVYATIVMLLFPTLSVALTMAPATTLRVLCMLSLLVLVTSPENMCHLLMRRLIYFSHSNRDAMQHNAYIYRHLCKYIKYKQTAPARNVIYPILSSFVYVQIFFHLFIILAARQASRSMFYDKSEPHIQMLEVSECFFPFRLVFTQSQWKSRKSQHAAKCPNKIQHHCYPHLHESSFKFSLMQRRAK